MGMSLAESLGKNLLVDSNKLLEYNTIMIILPSVYDQDKIQENNERAICIGTHKHKKIKRFKHKDIKLLWCFKCQKIRIINQ